MIEYKLKKFLELQSKKERNIKINKKIFLDLKKNEKQKVNKYDENSVLKNNFMDWNILDNEKWQIEKFDLKEKKRKHGFHNFDDLAALTYNKCISNIDVDIDDYNKKKIKTDEIEGNQHSSKTICNTIFIPNIKDIEFLSNLIKESNEKKFKHIQKVQKKKSDTQLMCVNTKNRDFNKKIS